MSVLVYDIGLHDGRDTGHYLREGFRVVAVDANPAMCAAAQTKFRDYVRTGQLKIINCGVAEQKGQLEFWVCDDNTEWSSFQRYFGVPQRGQESFNQHKLQADWGHHR